MNYSIISVRYAKALILAGSENKCLDELKNDMEFISATIRDNQIFKQLLDNPVVKPPQKRKVMVELLEKRVNPLTLNFINIIIHNRREIMLADIARDFIDLYENKKGIKRAHVVSAVEIEDTSKRQLQHQLNILFQADVHMTAETNPALLGGFVLRTGHQMYDASLATALEKIRKVMISS